MRRSWGLLAAVAALAAACGDDEPPAPAPQRPPAVQDRKEPVWCPKARHDQVKRPDGRYDVRTVPHGTFDARELLGLREAAAERLAEAGDCTMRVVTRDGEQLAVTQDLRFDRINVRVERGYVTAVRSIG